jgi:hypothetical protein
VDETISVIEDDAVLELEAIEITEGAESGAQMSYLRGRRDTGH